MIYFRKTQAPATKATNRPTGKARGTFASEAEFLAAEKQRFQKIFGRVDWNKVKTADAAATAA